MNSVGTPLGAVIFDLDGVLVDSEVISALVEVDLFATHGVSITTTEIYEHFVGLSEASMIEALRTGWEVDLPETFWAQRAELVAARFATHGRAVPGIVPVLDGLVDRQVPMAVASSSTPDSIEGKLSVTGLDGYFTDQVYSAAFVDRGKPAPDLFLHAAAQLGVDPAACVVIEDARPGVLAGVAAGMTVIGFTAAGHCGPGHGRGLLDAGAHHHASDAAQLARLLVDYPEVEA